MSPPTRTDRRPRRPRHIVIPATRVACILAALILAACVYWAKIM